MRMAIVGHDQDLALPHGVLSYKSIPRRLKPGIAITRIRFQMRAFRPLVPGVDEDQRSSGLGMVLHRIDECIFQPALDSDRCAVQKDRAAILAPRSVIPGGTDTSKQRVIRLLVMLAAIDKNRPVINRATEIFPNWADRVRDVRRSRIVGWKLNGGIEAILGWIYSFKRLRVGEIDFAYAVFPAPISPTCGSLLRRR